jgi:DNA segregation ATPase FtsK/SpoIIIE, S-DNA-T family
MSTTEQDAEAPGTDLVAVETAPEAIPVTDAPGVATYANVAPAEGQARPVIAEQWQRGNIRATLRQHGGKHWHRTRYHGVRAPLYGTRTAVFALRGAGRLIRVILAWWHCTGLWALESQAVAQGRAGHKDAMAAHQQGVKTRGARGKILAVCVVLLAGILTAAVVFAPWWTWPPVLAATVLALARYGKPAGRKIAQAAVIPSQYQAPTDGFIAEALGSIGIAGINAAIKAGRGLVVRAPAHRDGPGWGTRLELPRGVTAKAVMARREELASALHSSLSATWPSEMPGEHPGMLDLWIGFRDLAKMKKPAWPLLKAGTADVFGEFPFGTNPRSQRVMGTLFEHNWLIGAMPGQGKTAAIRVIGCVTALDVLAELWIHEHAGKGDLEPLARVSHRYVSGLDDESIAYAADSLARLRRELDRRSATLKRLPKDQRPDGKITREMGRNRSHHLYPIVAIFDEVQNVFTHPKYGKQAAEDAGYVIRLGRAYGVILVLGTQRPTSDMIPSAVSGNVSSRFCLKVPSYRETDLVLGTGSSSLGYRAEVFRSKTDAGMGWMKAEGEPQIVRTYYLDLPATERIAERARLLRERAGTLTGYAVEETDDDAARNFAADVLAIFAADTRLWSETIAARLAERLPEAYADITADAVASQLRGIGVPVVDVREQGKPNRKGAKREDVEQAATVTA